MFAINIYVYKNKAYLPVQARFESGIWVDKEPVLVAELKESELESAIKKIIDTGHQILPDPTPEEWKKQKSPLLVATGASSWRSIARNGASYSIYKKNQTIEIDMSYTDKKGRWQNDPQKNLLLPADSQIGELVKFILKDVKARPELH